MSDPSPSQTTPSDAKTGALRPDWRWRVALALVLALATYTRLTNFAGVFHDDTVFFGGLDSYYHARRVELTLAHFPRVPSFDAWVNHPEGLTPIWPAPFDLAIAAVAKVVQLAGGGRQAVEATVALFNPALGVLCCLAIFFLGRRLAGPLGGVLAAGLAALLPMLTNYSIVGRVDHHAAEPSLVVVPLLLLLRAVDDPRRRRWAIGCGAATAATLLIWTGGTIVGAILAFSLTLVGLLRRDAAADCAAVGGWTFAAAAVAMVPITLAHRWAWEGSFAYYAPSWLQPALFVVAALTFFAWAALERRRVGLPLKLVALFAVPLGSFALLALSAAGFRQTVVAVAGYVGRGEAQISQVTESLPLDWTRGVQQYTVLAYGAPLLLAFLVWRCRRGEPAARTRLQLCCASALVAAVLGLAQLRLGSLVAPLWCAAWALASTDAYRWLAPRCRRRWHASALAAAVLLLVLLPTLPLHLPVKISGTREFLGAYDALLWLRDAAASPGDPLRPRRRPRFAVMSRWQYGHWLNYVSRQANVANPFGQTPIPLRGVRDSVRFFLAEDPARALALLERRGARYVLVTPLLDELELVIRHTRRPLERYLRGKLVKPAYMALVNSRLFHQDGRGFSIAGRSYPPLRRLRLVFEGALASNELGRRRSFCKVFELVRGARLVGGARPGGAVWLTLRLRTNNGRAFVYRDRAKADGQGRFSFTVPYPTGTSEAVRSVGSYLLRDGDGRRWSVAVTREQVYGGGRQLLSPTSRRVSPADVVKGR